MMWHPVPFYDADVSRTWFKATSSGYNGKLLDLKINTPVL